MTKTAVVILLLALPVSLMAQMKPDAQLAEMKKLDFLVGEWKGSGWMEMSPGRRTTFTGIETVQSKLGGVVLEVEGLHKTKMPGKDEEVTIHHALGLFSYDEQAKLYRFRTYLASGRGGDFEAKVTEEGLEWGFTNPQAGTVRYTIKLNDKGEWFEIGERSRDGKSWTQFFEMSLQKVK